MVSEEDIERDMELSDEDIAPQEKPKKPTKADIELEKYRKMKEAEEKFLKEWHSKGDGTIIQEGVFYDMDKYIRMVASGISTGCVVVGEGGLSKSYTTISILNDLEIDYGYIDSYSTPVAFYVWMYENRNKILVLDDVIGIMQDKRGNAYLKSALWEVNGKRVVHNLSQKPAKNAWGDVIPDHFEFTGGIIILTNELNKKNAHIKAILTRVNFCEIELSYEQKMAIMQEIVRKPYKKLSLADRQLCFDSIEKFGKEYAEQINFRTLIKLYQYLEFAKGQGDLSIFEKLIASFFKSMEDKMVAEIKAIEAIPQVGREEKCRRWMLLTGQSRPTYFRILDKVFPELRNKEKVEVQNGVSDDKDKEEDKE